MTDKRKKRVRAHAAKTGMSYQASCNALTKPTEFVTLLVTARLESGNHDRNALILLTHGTFDETLQRNPGWRLTPNKDHPTQGQQGTRDMVIHVTYEGQLQLRAHTDAFEVIRHCRYDRIVDMLLQPKVLEATVTLFIDVPVDATRKKERDHRLVFGKPTKCGICNTIYGPQASTQQWFIVPFEQAEREVAVHRRMGRVVTTLYVNPEDPTGWVYYDSGNHAVMGYETRTPNTSGDQGVVVYKIMGSSPQRVIDEHDYDDFFVMWDALAAHVFATGDSVVPYDDILNDRLGFITGNTEGQLVHWRIHIQKLGPSWRAAKNPARTEVIQALISSALGRQRLAASIPGQKPTPEWLKTYEG